MLRKLNAGDIAGACDRNMKRWTFAGGKKQWQGLINRRDTEKRSMPRNPLALIIIAIILLTTALLAGCCYLYSLPNHCKASAPEVTRWTVVMFHYECEAP